MVRQISVTPEEAPKGVDAPGLGDWFSQALRTKGSLLPSRPPAPEPPPPELPPSEVEVEDPAASFAGWLARDLIPKHSLRPSPFASLAPARDSGAPPASVSASEASLLPEPAIANEGAANGEQSLPYAPAPLPGGEGSARPNAPQDSLAPQMVPPAPAGDVIEPDLDDDDLSVLPGRRKAKVSGPASSGTKKYALGVLALLLLVGAFVMRGGGPSDAALADTTHAAASDVAAALPPPPTDIPAEAEPAPEAPTVPHVKHSASSTDPEELADPRSFLGGPSVRRYADVPSPTLSRLASEQRRLQRQREEVVRKAKANAKVAP
jgi:hypothetical protein